MLIEGFKNIKKIQRIMSRISMKISGVDKKLFPEMLVAARLLSGFAQRIFISLVLEQPL